MGPGISRLESECWEQCSFTQVAVYIVYAGGRGGRWHLPAPLFLERLLNYHYPSGTHSEMSKVLSPPRISLVFFKLLLLHYKSVGRLSYYLFKGRDSASYHPPSSPGAIKLTVFNIPGIKFCLLYEFMKFGPLLSTPSYGDLSFPCSLPHVLFCFPPFS